MDPLGDWPWHACAWFGANAAASRRVRSLGEGVGWVRQRRCVGKRAGLGQLVQKWW
jgi:hypothetical protein